MIKKLEIKVKNTLNRLNVKVGKYKFHTSNSDIIIERSCPFAYVISRPFARHMLQKVSERYNIYILEKWGLTSDSKVWGWYCLSNYIQIFRDGCQKEQQGSFVSTLHSWTSLGIYYWCITLVYQPRIALFLTITPKLRFLTNIMSNLNIETDETSSKMFGNRLWKHNSV